MLHGQSLYSPWIVNPIVSWIALVQFWFMLSICFLYNLIIPWKLIHLFYGQPLHNPCIVDQFVSWITLIQSLNFVTIYFMACLCIVFELIYPFVSWIALIIPWIVDLHSSWIILIWSLNCWSISFIDNFHTVLQLLTQLLHEKLSYSSLNIDPFALLTTLIQYLNCVIYIGSIYCIQCSLWRETTPWNHRKRSYMTGCLSSEVQM